MNNQGFRPTNQSIAAGGVDEDVTQILALAEGGLALSSTGGTLTADGTEQALYIDNEPLGCWNPIVLFVDLDNMVAGDAVTIRVYYRIRDGGGLQLWDAQIFVGIDGSLANGAKIMDTSFEPNRHGFRVTLQQTAGVMRAYDWEFFAGI